MIILRSFFDQLSTYLGREHITSNPSKLKVLDLRLSKLLPLSLSHPKLTLRDHIEQV